MLYKNGLPFDENHAKNLDALKKRVLEDNKGGVLIFTGVVGGGKTTLAVNNADYIAGAYEKKGKQYVLNEKLLIDFEKSIATGSQELKTKLIKTFDEGLNYLIWDEAGDFNNRSYLTNLNKDINRLFEVSRAFKIVVFLCLPNFYVLDKNILNVGVIQGVVFVYGRTKATAKFKVFDAEKTNRLITYMVKSVDKIKVIKNFRPNYYGYFLDLPKKRAGDLERFSIMGKKAIVLNLFEKDKSITTTIKGGEIVQYKE